MCGRVSESVCACVWKKPTESTPVLIFCKCQSLPPEKAKISYPMSPRRQYSGLWSSREQGFTLDPRPGGPPTPSTALRTPTPSLW